jgi:hypothetical protein
VNERLNAKCARLKRPGRMFLGGDCNSLLQFSVLFGDDFFERRWGNREIQRMPDQGQSSQAGLGT